MAICGGQWTAASSHLCSKAQSKLGPLVIGEKLSNNVSNHEKKTIQAIDVNVFGLIFPTWQAIWVHGSQDAFREGQKR